MRKALLLLTVLIVAGLLVAGCSNDPGPTQSKVTQQDPVVAKQGIPSTATIDSAAFYFYVTEAAEQSVTVHQVTADWMESDVTWNSLGSNFNTDTAGSFDVAATGWVSVDITDLAKGWFDSSYANYGILLNPSDADTNMVEYASHEASENQPYLQICYTVNGNSECETFMAAMDASISEEHPDSSFGTEDYFETGRDTAASSTVRSVVQAPFEVYVPTSTIGDFVWNDLNMNGIQDEGEPGLPGITVNLYDCADTGMIASTTTDDMGHYMFDSVETGEYLVEVVAPEYWAFSPMDQGDDDALDSDVNPETGRTDCFMLDPGVTDLSVDAGLYSTLASVGDFVWNDLNMNGIQDEGEPGLADITVKLYDCSDTTMVATTTTDDMGHYMFDSVVAGDYLIEVVPPQYWVFSPMDQGSDDALDSDVNPETGRTDCFTLSPGMEDLTVDAGIYEPPAEVGDFVWNDLNMNGIQDEGEPGLEGITVNLYTCDSTLVGTDTTDAMGMYHFEMLKAGDYYLGFVNPFGWIFTYQDQGTNDSLDSDVNRYYKTTECFTLVPGQTDNTWDAGLFEYNGCTRGKGYWKNHAGFGPQPDMVTPLLLPIYLGNHDGAKSIEVADAQTAYDILTQKVYGVPSNGITKLYAHLLTAKLNIVGFANPEDVYDAIQAADDFLSDHDWQDWDTLSKDDRKMVQQWKGMFERYNEGYIGPGTCGDDDHDGGYDDGNGYDDSGDDLPEDGSGTSKPVRMY